MYETLCLNKRLSFLKHFFPDNNVVSEKVLVHNGTYTRMSSGNARKVQKVY